MRKEVEFIRTNKDLRCDVKLFLSKGVCIEDMKVKLELELKRKGIKPVKEEYLLGEIKESKITKLNDYGLDLDVYEVITLVDKMKYMSTQSSGENEEYYHKNVGWYEPHNGRVFRANHIIGSNLKSKLSEDKYILSKKGCIDDWLESINNFIMEDRYLALIVVIGFTSILTKLFNLENQIGSLIFNIHGGLSTERDMIMNMLNSIWADPFIKDKGLCKVFNDKVKNSIDLVEGNEGLSILVKNMDKKGICNLVNEIQSKNIDSTLVLSSENEILNPNDIKNILNKDNITEIDLDIYSSDKLKKNINIINKLIRQNYGHAGEKFVEYIFEKGIDMVLDEYYLMINTVEMDLNEREISSGKAAKIAIVLLTAIYMKESLKLIIDIDQLKEVIFRLDDDSNIEKEKYKLAFEDIVNYFNRNKSKYILKGEDIKANSEGLYELNDEGVLDSIIIPNTKFKEIMDSLGYDKNRILRVWNEKGILVNEPGRNDKKVSYGVGSPTRCIIIKVKDGELLD